LCTGYGGLDLGVLAALGGGLITWVANSDRHIAQVLAARMPGVPNLGDLRDIDWVAVEPVDVVVAGWPCQDMPTNLRGRRTEAAIHRWETVLGRSTPHRTQPGNHGRLVLAPAFVEHLMGLLRRWVTDLPLPRTAQLRALGNGVIPHQATHAVSLLLDDLAELLDTDHQPATSRNAGAA
jgi:DNA (cytosine-5)-methyltransferase 1